MSGTLEEAVEKAREFYDALPNEPAHKDMIRLGKRLDL